MITGNLSLTSKMDDFIKHPSIFDELEIFYIDNCKLLVKKKSGLYFPFKYDQFQSMTVNELVNIKNIDDDYMIEIKEKK